jgi:hypothetical protein
MMTYWWISTPSATFAITVRDGIVVETADYIKRWSIGKPVDTVMARYRKRLGVTVVELAI